MAEKKCTKCLVVKPLTEFYRDSTLTTGFRSECKVCYRKRKAAYVEQNREKVLASQREYWHSTQGNALGRNLDSEIAKARELLRELFGDSDLSQD